MFRPKNWHHIRFQLEVSFDFGAKPKILCENITELHFERMSSFQSWKLRKEQIC